MFIKGPFSQKLLGIDNHFNELFEIALLEKHEVLRPGYTRISLPFWISPEEIDFIINSLLFIANNGWKFLYLYRLISILYYYILLYYTIVLFYYPINSITFII